MVPVTDWVGMKFECEVQAHQCAAWEAEHVGMLCNSGMSVF